MRSSLLSRVRAMTSSRQSPRMSAHRHGFAFVPLFDAQPWSAGEQRRLAARSRQSHLRDRRRRRAARAAGRRPTRRRCCTSAACASEIFSPLTLHSPPTPVARRPHLVARGGAGRCPAPRRGRRRPAVTAMPTDLLAGPGVAELDAAGLRAVARWLLNTSRPGRSGSRSATCMRVAVAEAGRVQPLAVASITQGRRRSRPCRRRPRRRR